MLARKYRSKLVDIQIWINFCGLTWRKKVTSWQNNSKFLYLQVFSCHRLLIDLLVPVLWVFHQNTIQNADKSNKTVTCCILAELTKLWVFLIENNFSQVQVLVLVLPQLCILLKMVQNWLLWQEICLKFVYSEKAKKDLKNTHFEFERLIIPA